LAWDSANRGGLIRNSLVQNQERKGGGAVSHGWTLLGRYPSDQL
jgi:hypothetical protein